jgi:hypothetical protein
LLIPWSVDAVQRLPMLLSAETQLSDEIQLALNERFGARPTLEQSLLQVATENILQKLIAGPESIMHGRDIRLGLEIQE